MRTDATDRGIIIRPETITKIELCAGREGDDTYLQIKLGDELDQQKLTELLDVLLTLRYAFETAKNDRRQPPTPEMVRIGRDELRELLNDNAALKQQIGRFKQMIKHLLQGAKKKDLRIKELSNGQN
jgi:hypothetical protein